MHALIERKAKHKSIYTQAQWCTIMKKAKVKKDSYAVKVVKQSDIYNFTDFSNLFNWVPVKIASVREINVQPNENFIRVKYDFHEKSKKIKIFKKNNDLDDVQNYNLKEAYDAQLVLAERKQKDLRKMLDKNMIPPEHCYFYENILGKDN